MARKGKKEEGSAKEQNETKLISVERGGKEESIGFIWGGGHKAGLRYMRRCRE